MLHIGKNIAHVRELRHIKQVDMAKRLNFSQQKYSNIERTGKVTDFTLERIAKELDVTIAILKSYVRDNMLDSLLHNTNVSIKFVLHYEIKASDVGGLTRIIENLNEIAQTNNLRLEPSSD